MGVAVVVCLIVASAAVTAIERLSQEDVQRVLSVDGHDWVDVTVDGLVVGLGGQAPDEATRFRALTVAGTAVDAARLVDGMEVSTPEPIEPPRFSIEILRNDDGVALFGLIPEQTDRDAMLVRVAAIAGGGTVTDLMETADYPPPPGWQQAVAYSLDALAELPRSKISVAADRVAITATTESTQVKRRAETKLSGLAPSGVRLELNLSAPRPVIAPFTLAFHHRRKRPALRRLFRRHRPGPQPHRRGRPRGRVRRCRTLHRGHGGAVDPMGRGGGTVDRARWPRSGRGR